MGPKTMVPQRREEGAQKTIILAHVERQSTERNKRKDTNFRCHKQKAARGKQTRCVTTKPPIEECFTKVQTKRWGFGDNGANPRSEEGGEEVKDVIPTD